MNNPLLENTALPQFSKIKPEHIEPAIDSLLAEARKTIARCLQENSEYNWDNLVQPIALAGNRLAKAWSPINHMNAVVNTDALRAAYNACLPKLSDYTTEVGQNQALFKAYQYIADSAAYANLTPAQQKIISNELRDFRLSGVDLDPDQQQRYKQISQQLAALSSNYSENLLDASNAWSKHISDQELLAGLPDTALALAQQTAHQQQQTGWLIDLQFPTYLAVMTYADNRELRQQVYTAFATRASEQGPNAGRWDNSLIMEQLLRLRHEQAQLLGFNNYAELSLSTKMAKSPDEVSNFLENLVDESWRQARQDGAELEQFANQYYGISKLQAWDVAYYSEKMRQQLHQLSQQELKLYFPVTRVVPGLFAVVKKLYGLTITEISAFDSWHSDVRLFQVADKDKQLRGQFFLDLYARPKKRDGAWMDECVSRQKIGEQVQLPVAYLNCNFTPPTGNDPALLTHEEVLTLFHEFGHGLQHIVTQIDHWGVSGINGVEWDAVELPSQFMENWCWQAEALTLISGHYQTDEPLPATLLQKMLESKNFQAGMSLLRQLELSLFDFSLHHQYEPAKGGQIYQTLERIRARLGVIQLPKFNRMAHSFSHIFAGEYAAGYYSYKWAEVLSSDAFSRFEECGIFDQASGQAFLHTVLEQGGSKDALQLFVDFRGREPTIDALLRHIGISA